MSKFPLLSRPQQRKTMTPAALAANKANAQKAGRPKGKMVFTWMAPAEIGNSGKTATHLTRESDANATEFNA